MVKSISFKQQIIPYSTDDEWGKTILYLRHIAKSQEVLFSAMSYSEQFTD